MPGQPRQPSFLPRMRLRLLQTYSFQTGLKLVLPVQLQVCFPALFERHSRSNHRYAAGDEADSIATAPALAQVDSVFPLIKPDTSDKQGKKFDVLQHFGNLSPWQSIKSFGVPNTSPLVPDGCSLVQTHLLHRHGARYPTSNGPPSAFATRINAAATGTGFSASGPMQFLNTWNYKLGAEILTPFGRSQL